MKTKVKTTQLPEDFELTEKRRHRALAYWSDPDRNSAGLKVADEFHLFTNHWWAKGEGKSNWDSAWNTWYAKAVKWNEQKDSNKRKGSNLRGVRERTRQIFGGQPEYVNSINYLEQIGKGEEPTGG